jgi:CubicO group peptidase (beta-lactamase class C family)
MLIYYLNLVDMRRILVGLISCLLFALGSCASDPEPNKAPTAKDFAGRLDSVLRTNGQAGISYCQVVGESVIASGGVGFADVEKKTAVSDSTVFRVGSISKSFVALGILRLVQQGKLRLDEPVKGLLPPDAINNPWEATHPVRLANLLEHTAGLDDMHFNEVGSYAPMSLRIDSTLTLNSRSRKSRWQPSTRHAYSNPDFTLAAAVIEHVTKQHWEVYLRDSVLRPLGMHDSDFELTPTLRKRLAIGYGDDTSKVEPYLYIAHAASGSLHSTARDMAQFLRFLLNNGKINGQQWLRADLLDRMRVPNTTLAAKQGLKEGYGLAHMSDEDYGYHSYGHSGGMLGFLSSYKYFPELGTGYFFSLNGQSGSTMRKMDSLFAEAATHCDTCKKPAATASVPVSPDTLSSYTGYYMEASPRNQLLHWLTRIMTLRKVSVEHDTLYITAFFGGEATRLIPTSKHIFREADANYPTYVFGLDDDRNPFLSADDDYLVKVNWFESAGLAILISASVLYGYLFGGLFALILLIVLVIRAFLKRKTIAYKPWGHILLGFLSLVVFLGTIQMSPFQHLGEINIYSSLIFLSSIGLMYYPVMGLISAFRNRKRHGHWLIRFFVASFLFLQLTLSVYMLVFGAIGMRTWV